MADERLKDSLSVHTKLHLQQDGWEFLSYDTDPETGFLIRDPKQGKQRLEILYWKQDREHDDTQFVLDAETGNVGIGATNPSDKLTIRGGGLSFQQADQDRPEMGIDYDAASQSLRIRARKGEATGLSDAVLTITKEGQLTATAVKANTLQANGANQSLALASSGTGALLLNPTGGKVGIGRTAPNAMLDISTPEPLSGSLLRFSPQYGEGKAYYLDVRAETEPNIIRYTFDLMNNNTKCPNNLVLQSGKVGIGMIPQNASLEVNGTVKATAFNGSGAQITGIKASSISEGVLAVERIPGLPNLTGKLPASKIDGELSQWTTEASRIYYEGRVRIGPQPIPSRNAAALKAIKDAAQTAQSASTAAQSIIANPLASDMLDYDYKEPTVKPLSGDIATYRAIAAKIAAAASAATTQIPGSAATTAQIERALVDVGKQVEIAATETKNLRDTLVTAYDRDIYTRPPMDMTGTRPKELNKDKTKSARDFASLVRTTLDPVITEVRKSSQALQQGSAFITATAASLDAANLTVSGDSCLTGTFMCWGNIIGNGSIQGFHSDLAENYLSDMDLAAADVVCLDQSRDRIIRSTSANDPLVIGVISSAPGFLLNAQGEANPASGTLAYPVALCGRVPCKVSDENGPICRGDLLTASSTAGHAMKAVPVNLGGIEVYRPGTIIGKALEPLHSGKGMIEVFVTLR